MDRAALLVPAYPAAAFVDAFYHVVWSRRGSLTIPPSPLYASFREAARECLTRRAFPATCPKQQPPNLCPACSDVSAWLFDASVPCARMCEPRARALIEYLFFGDAVWTGELPPCALRCHTIVTSRDAWAVAEAIAIPICTPPPHPRARHGINRISLVLDRETEALGPRILSENVAVISASLVVLCKVIAPADAARQLYIDLRESLRTGTCRTAQVESVRALVLQTLFSGHVPDCDVPADLLPHAARLRDFWTRHAALGISAHDLPSLSELRPRRSTRLMCRLTRDHERVENASQFGSYVELFWPDSQMSPLECRLTVRLWTELLKFVDPMHVLIKALPCGKNSIVLRRTDYVRLLQYSPSRLHCARIISLRMPVYKMMTQNYVEANMTHDHAGAVAFVKDLVSLITTSIPDQATDHHHKDIGMLHALLALYGDSLPLHVTKPYLEVHNMRITSHETRTVQTETGGFSDLATSVPRITPFHNVADNATVVEGFEWTSLTLYGCLAGFLCIREPHIILATSVRTLFELMTRHVREQPTFRVAMSVVSELWGRFSRPAIVINSNAYVDIPIEMPCVFGVPPVTYIYGFLLSEFIDRRLAGQLLLTIRLCPEKTPFLSRPSPLRLAETRDEGLVGMHALAREYSPTPPTGPFALLYSSPGVAELGCLQYMLFYLEMLTYVQCNALHCDNLSRCIKEYARCGNRPHPPLHPNTFRGSVTPHHVVRYARRDMTHDPARTRFAYELEPGVFQHEVVPTVRFHEAHRADDYARLGPESPFVGADPLLLEATFMIPVDRILVESQETKAKRKLEDRVADAFARNPDLGKRMRYGLGPPSPSWSDEVRIVNMALSSR